MPKFKTTSDLFFFPRGGGSLGGEQEVDMTILFKDTWPPIKETMGYLYRQAALETDETIKHYQIQITFCITAHFEFQWTSLKC